MVIVGRLNVAMTTETLVTKLNRKESLPSVSKLSKHVCRKNDKTRRGMEGWKEGWTLIEEFSMIWFPGLYPKYSRPEKGPWKCKGELAK